MQKEGLSSEYRFADCLGKKVLITGDLGSGKTALLAKLLDEAINSKQGAKITVIDMAPGKRDVGSYTMGKTLRYYLKNLDLVQYMAPKNVYAPRLDGGSKEQVEKLALANAKNIGALFSEFMEKRSKILFINDVTLFLHRGELARLLKVISKCSTFVANGYRGKFPADDMGTGISRRERRLLDKLQKSMDIVIEL
ncbi:MAG: GTP-binding protein [Thaumarchaeota archaeon]|nr:GTP-binding protein [Nitrososphaerota archaeon]